jgi:hemolysin activation/secretion protein
VLVWNFRCDIRAIARPRCPRHGFRIASLALGCLALSAYLDAARGEGARDAAPAPESAPATPTTANPGAPGASKTPEQKPPQQKPPVQHFDIDEYRVEGADLLPQIEVEEAVYPFLGPNRSSDDVEKARAALEKAYTAKGYQTVSVSVPQQNVSSRVVVLKVVEGKVGRVRVNNSRFFDLDKIKQKAPSLAEGKVPNFNDVTKDIYALNQLPDRKVTPALRAGATPGTVDVDLNVEDKLPFHSTFELNNRRSPNTTALRASATTHYDNLWQRGDSFSFTYQEAPLRLTDSEAMSGSYLARTEVDWLNLMVYAVKSKSNVATVGNFDVIGPGVIVGSRVVLSLPNRPNFFHTFSAGFDYKHFDQTVTQSATGFSTPITYYPVVGTYGATLQGENALTQLNATVTANVRGLGSEPQQFDDKRFKATASFIALRGDLSHTQDLKDGTQLYGKVQGQIGDQPLVSSEEFSLGGQDTVRGYLESEVLGDKGVVGTLELRSPSLPDFVHASFKDASGKPVTLYAIQSLRFFLFADGGVVATFNALPQQQDRFDLASYGIGTTFKMFDHLNGMVALADPLTTQAFTRSHDPHLLFRVWGEF